MKMMVIGGLQDHQTPRCDGICPTLTASMGMGGGYVPMILSERKDIWRYYDVYNKRICKNLYCGTLTTHPQDGHSGTFWVMVKADE